MKNRFSRGLLISMILVVVPFWWLLIDADRSAGRPKPVDIVELRALAAAIPGQHPTAVTYTLLAMRQTVGDYFAAGIGLRQHQLAIIAWSLPVPGKGPIMIDPGAPPAAANVGRFDNFDRTRQSRLDAEARQASLVLFTQGTALPQAQAGPQAVAPGVVVIPAPGHAPGARLIFVQLANGEEFLFTGDIATFTENWSRLRARSRLAAAWGPPQDRAETYGWLRTIRQLRTEAPDLRIVPGHDYTWLIKQRSSGVISERRPGPIPQPAQSQIGKPR
jgi:hypothetical protein